MGAKEGILTAHNEYSYDAKRGNLVEIRHNTDGNTANDVVYSFEQDALGRQTAVKVGSQTLSQSAYQNDPTKPNFGTLTATTYGNGAKVSSRYDDFNRVTGVVYGEETAPRYEYDYNAKGQVARVRDNLLNRTTQSEYDLANRPVRVKTSEDAKHVYTGQVAYDNVYGNLSEFTEKVGENRQEYGTKFGYDDENRPTSLTYSIGATTIGQSTTTIDKLNRTTFSAVKLGSKTFTSEYHFAAGGYGTGSVTNLVASITQPGCNCGYGYDDNGNIASATLNGKWTGYTYDELGQLIQVNDHSDTRSGENGTTWKYTYDLGGNILKKERFAYADTTNPLETVTYTYGDANWRDKLTAVNGSTIRYDAIGNPLNDGTWTYTWQNGRQLQKMQKSGVTAEFVYNADGLRVQKTVNGVATKYTLHGKNVVHMTSGTDELHFFYDAQNRPAVVVYNGMAYAYVKSLQGDIVAILDESGNAVVSYGYDAWGAPLWCTGELAETLGKVQPFRYRGYVFDEETGLYYLRSRYYNAERCRFVNADDCFSEKNLYCYCINAPVERCDPSGHEYLCIAMYRVALNNTDADSVIDLEDIGLKQTMSNRLIDSGMLTVIVKKLINTVDEIHENSATGCLEKSDYHSIFLQSESEFDIYMAVRSANAYINYSEVKTSSNAVLQTFSLYGFQIFQVDLTLTDRYDFHELGEDENSFVRWVNNTFGYELQESGAITPYYWTYSDTFYLIASPNNAGSFWLSSGQIGDK